MSLSCILLLNQISFTMYPTHSRVGRGILVLRHSILHFLPNSRGTECRVAHFALTLERGNGNIHLSKYFTSSSGHWTHNQSVLESHLCPCATTGLNYWLWIIFISCDNSSLKCLFPDSRKCFTIVNLLYVSFISIRHLKYAKCELKKKEELGISIFYV